ncbi:MAG: polysaccharide export protein [Nitrospirae bacterium]|nr:polysaccharide export protein [Nitrospirota bacterium]
MTLFCRILAGLCAFFLTGCELLPGVAPSSTQLVRTQDESWEVFLVKVSSLITKALASARGPAFPPSFRTQSYTPSVTLKPGDVIGITVYEQAGSTIFSGTVAPLVTGTPGLAAPPATTLPQQVIETDGRISVPYVGRVRVAGSTPSQAAEMIQRGLEGQTVRPQVVVSLASNPSNTVSVGGEINKAGLMPLTLRGERLLDAVAWGGGPKFTAAQMDIRLMRGRQVFSLPLQEIMANPEDNIVAQPNDNIVLVHNPKTFLVMGATQKVNQYPFEVENVTLAEAIARAGGGIDTMTNLAAIYLFRYEPGSVARAVLSADKQAVDDRYVTPRMASLANDASVPVVYRVDLTQADGYFFAQQIRLRDKDVVLMATSQMTQFLKVMMVIRSITGTYYDLTRSSNN